MRARYRRGLSSAARAAMTWMVLKLEDLGLAIARAAAARRRRAPLAPRREERQEREEARPPEEKGEIAPSESADERTMRRVAEAQRGGLSSAESDARFASGENPGGTHHKAVRREEGPEHPRPEREEPQERRERVPGGERSLPATRRGG